MSRVSHRPEVVELVAVHGSLYDAASHAGSGGDEHKPAEAVRAMKPGDHAARTPIGAGADAGTRAAAGKEI